MSILTYLVKVVPEVAEKIRAEPDLLLQVWREVELTDRDIVGISDSDPAAIHGWSARSAAPALRSRSNSATGQDFS